MGKKKEKKGVVGRSVIWACGGASSGMLYLFMTHLAYCLTESAGMSALIVGNIFLFSRLFDGITDFIAGYIIDHTHTKWGKARLYDLATIPAWIFVVMCFSIPNGWGNAAKIVFLLLVYNMNNSVFYTLASCANTVRMKRTFNQDEMVKVTAISGVISALVNAVGTLVIPVLISVFESRPHGWTIIALIFAVPGCVLTLIQFFFLPEVYTNMEEDRKNAQKIKFFESVKLLFQNKYAIILFMVMLPLGIAGNTGIGDYYYKYVFGNVGVQSVAGLFSFVGIFFLAFLPKLVSKFGTQKAIMYTMVLTVAGNALRYFFPTSIAWCGITTMIAMVGTLPFNYMRSPLLIDCMDYGQYKSGKDLEGVYSAVLSVVNKIALGLGPVILGVCLEVSGYDSMLKTQSAGAVSMIKFLYNGLPAIAALIGVIFMGFFNVEKQLPQIREELKARGELVKHEG